MNKLLNSTLHCFALIYNCDCDLRQDLSRAFSSTVVSCMCFQDGETPLHKAAMKGRIEVCQELLAAGADCNIKNTVKNRI